MAFKLNFADTELFSFDPIPAGTYEFEVVDAETKTSNAGNEYINLQMAVAGGDFDGRRVFAGLHFTEKALGMTMGALMAFGYEEEELRAGIDLDPEDLLGEHCLARVKVTSGRVNPETGEEYAPKNEIASWIVE